jgi:predicted secreted protein
MKPFKTNKIGWDDGHKVKVVGRKKWNSTYVYKLRVFGSKTHWVEFHEHKKLQRNRVFCYDESGEYRGRYYEQG